MELLLGVIPFLWITTTILLISNLHRDELEKDRQSELAASERFAKATIDALSAHLAVVNSTGTIVEVNQAWRAFAQSNPPVRSNVHEGANYLSVCEAVPVDHPDYKIASAVARGLRDVLAGQQASFTLEYACPSKAHNYWFIVHITRFPGDGDVYAAIVHENITERKHVEAALQVSESRFRAFFEDVPVAIWEEDFSLVKQYLDGLRANGITDFRAYFEMHPEEVKKCAHMIRLLDVNNTALKMYKAESKEALFASTMQTVSQGEQENNLEDFIAIAEGKLSHRWEGSDQTLAGDQIEISLSWSVAPHYENDYSKVIVTTLDITELKRAEERVRTSQEQLLSLVKEAPISIAMLDREMRYIVTSQRWISDYGQKYSDLVGLSHYEVNPDIPERWKIIHQQGLSGETLKNDDDLWVLEDGSKTWLRWAIVPWHDASGKVGGIIISAEDITERKQAEDDLRFHEAILRETGQIAKVGGWTFNIPTGDGYWTEEVARIHDLAPNDPTSKEIGLSFYVEESRARIEAAIQKTIEDATPYDLELELITAKGNHKWVRTIGHPIIENGIVVSLRGSFQDITQTKQAQIALIESHLQFRTLFEASPDAIVLIDPHQNWQIIDCNTTACSMNGYLREELIGQSIDILNLTPADPMERDEYLKHIRETGIYQLETFHRRGDGTIFPVEVSTSLITLGGREIILGIDRDITDRKKSEAALRQSEIRLNGVIQSAMDAIISLNSEQSIVLFNAAAEKMFGLTAAEVLGQPLDRFIPKRFRAGHSGHIRIFSQTGMTNRAMGALGMIAGVRADGQEFPIEASISQVEMEEGKLYTVILRDVTERHQAEADIRRLNAALEQRVAERTAQLSEANKELTKAREIADRANLAKSEFLSRMSHELRTPLNAILGFGQLLGMDALDARQMENINHILRAGKHLLGLINEVLDISRIETGNLSISPEPVRVKDLIEETVELVEGMAARRNIQIHPVKLSSEYVLADRQRLKQILINLLSNAIKYNQDGGQVIIDCLEVPTEHLQIRITDTGPGISDESQTRIFVPFSRLGAENSPVEGTGLGLSLSRRLAEVMGGKLEVASELGKGSTFWVELPIVESPMEESYHHHDGILLLTPKSDQTFKQTVLCIEDNLSNFQLIEQIFNLRTGVKLLASEEGLTGLKIARTQPPDLILLDLNLPDISGNEVLHRLKADPSTQTIPVIVLSADATPRQQQRLMAAGAYAYLTKPLDIDQFLKVLDELLSLPAKS